MGHGLQIFSFVEVSAVYWQFLWSACMQLLLRAPPYTEYITSSLHVILAKVLKSAVYFHLLREVLYITLLFV
jgi:hypothetical protein